MLGRTVFAVRQASFFPFLCPTPTMECLYHLGMHRLAPLSATNVRSDPYRLVVFGVLDRVAGGGAGFLSGLG